MLRHSKLPLKRGSEKLEVWEGEMEGNTLKVKKREKTPKKAPPPSIKWCREDKSCFAAPPPHRTGASSNTERQYTANLSTQPHSDAAHK